jgi:hypothetical protein
VNHLPARAELAASSARRRVEERTRTLPRRLRIQALVRAAPGRARVPGQRAARPLPAAGGAAAAPRARRRSRSESSRRHVYTDDILGDILGDIWMI